MKKRRTQFQAWWMRIVNRRLLVKINVFPETSLFFSYVTDIGLVQARIGVRVIESIRISTLDGMIGFLIGGSLPFLFSAFSIKAVAKGAIQVVTEVRRQFKIPGVLEGTKKPDYARVVSITTAAAQKELTGLVVLSVASPILIGLIFQVEALGAFLAGVIVSGQLLAVFMSITGGALDNAKKYIEDGNLGGKGSLSHKASVEGDTVGDPLKDTAGPALNPMIKVVNLVSLLAAPVIVQYSGTNVAYVAISVLLALLGWVMWQSRK